ncbi:hypothetical protein BN1110_02402 [bacterium YEK0313]|nr:hypothetical protein BN1110_02402 [bacterium YEK0313]
MLGEAIKVKTMIDSNVDRDIAFLQKAAISISENVLIRRDKASLMKGVAGVRGVGGTVANNLRWVRGHAEQSAFRSTQDFKHAFTQEGPIC